MKKVKMFSLVVFSVLLFAGYSNISAQEKSKSIHNHGTVKSDSTKMKNSHEAHKMKSEKKNPIIREGVIDVASIDKNKDGKVYQDMMCWNVISDEAGDCPLCDMKLKEVTIEKAKTNLKKNGYKFK